MTITESYRDYRLGKITKARFMERARKDHHLKGLVNNVMSFDDTVKVLKNRGIISEAPIIIPAEVRKGVNFELGLTYEPIPDWTDHDFYTEEDVKKVEAKVIKNLEKDPVYYTKLIGTGEKPGGDKTEYGVEYKESNVSDTTNKTKGDGYVKKEVKKDAESNVQTSLSKSEKRTGKPEGVKQLKESYNSVGEEGDDLEMLLSKVYDIRENSGDMNLHPELEALISQYKTAQGVLSPEGVKKVESFLISNDLEDLLGYVGGDTWTDHVQNIYANRRDAAQSFQDANDLSEKKPLKNMTKDRLREVIRKHVKEAIFQKGKETVTASSPTSTGILKQKGYRPVSGTDDAKPIA